MSEFTPADKYAIPEYWHELIDHDRRRRGRKEFEAEVVLADQLLSNNLDLGLDVDIYAVQPSTWMKTFQYITGRMLYGKMRAKVEGVEDQDMDTAEMYEAGVNWEFSRPRGLYNKVGRRQIRRSGEDWISYGLGGFNTYWDSAQRSTENPTGSIINEAIAGKDLILDGDVDHFDDINRISRFYQKTTAEVAMLYPWLEPKQIPHIKGVTNLFDVQFRTPQRIVGKLSTAETREIMSDDSLVIPIQERERFEHLYRKSHRGAKRSESTKAWDALQTDTHVQPMVYSFQFLCDNETFGDTTAYKTNNVSQPQCNYLPINQEARYVGRDYSYTLLPFLFQPKRVYPAGAAKFIYGDQVYEGLLLTLYLEMLKQLNNTGVGVNLDKIVGETDSAKLEEIKRFMQEKSYPLALRGIEDVNAALSQLRRNPPPREMLLGADTMAYRGEDFFQTHPGQTGQTPAAGTPFRSMALAQQAGSTIAAHMVDSITNFVESIHKKTATLIYEFLPKDKEVQLTRMDGAKRTVVLQKEKIRKVNPQHIDIVVEMDTDTEAQKAQKKQEEIALYELGISTPEDLMKAMGIRNIKERLSRNRKFSRGVLITNMEDEHPGLKEAINAAMQTHLQEKGTSDGRQ